MSDKKQIRLVFLRLFLEVFIIALTLPGLTQFTEMDMSLHCDDETYFQILIFEVSHVSHLKVVVFECSILIAVTQWRPI